MEWMDWKVRETIGNINWRKWKTCRKKLFCQFSSTAIFCEIVILKFVLMFYFIKLIASSPFITWVLHQLTPRYVVFVSTPLAMLLNFWAEGDILIFIITFLLKHSFFRHLKKVLKTRNSKMKIYEHIQTWRYVVQKSKNKNGEQ